MAPEQRGEHAAIDSDGEPLPFLAVLPAADPQEGIDLLAGLPRDPGTSFILFVAGSPGPDLDLAAFLAPHSPLPVVTVEDGMPVLGDMIYLAPPSGHLELQGGLLRVRANGALSRAEEYDRLLQSLADSAGQRAIAFLWPGAEESPGSIAIRAAGGRVFPAGLVPGRGPGDEIAPSAAPHTGAAAAKHGAGGFFRDDATLLELRDEHLILLATHRLAQGEPMRIWVLGCDAGEEAYTIAMVAADTRDEVGGGSPFQILATVMDETALEAARRAVYPRKIDQEVPAGHLTRYFTPDEAGWRVRPELRERVTFDRYDALAPPPSHLDLVVCRDMLSSCGPEEGSGLLSRLLSALQPGGLLLLGPDDRPTAIPGLEAISPMHGLYRRSRAGEDPAFAPAAAAARGESTELRRAADLEILAAAATEAFIPPSVLIDGSGRILASLGAVGHFLEGGADVSSRQVLAAVTPWLRRGVAQAIAEARRMGETAILRAVPPFGGSGSDIVTLRVQPVGGEGAGTLLVSFLELTDFPEGFREHPADMAQLEQLVALERSRDALQREVEALRHDLAAEQQQAHQRVHEAEALHEELIAARDALASQLRSLVASAAELQQEERRSRAAATEMQAIIASSGIAFLLLDTHLNISFFTPSRLLPFRMIPGDIGRPLADIAPLVPDPSLLDEALMVLRTREPASRELEGPPGEWLMRRIHPFLDPEPGMPAGVVVTYTDIRETKAAAAHAEAMRGMAADVIRSFHQPLILLDANLHVVFANDPFREIFGREEEEVGARMVISAALRAAPQLSTFLTNRDDHAGRIDDCVVQVSLPARGPRTLRLVASRVPPGRTLLAVDDITERVLVTASLEKAKTEAERASRDKSRRLASASQELRQPLRQIEAFYRALPDVEDEAGPPRHLKRLGYAIGEMSGVLDALQDGAQLDMGTIEVVTSAFPIGTILSGIDADFARTAQKRGIRWRVLGSERMVFSDARLLRRTLWHLVAVLLRHTPVTRILIGSRPRGAGVCIEVRTQGLQLPLAALRTGLEIPQEGHARGEGSEAMRLGLEVARRLGELLDHAIHVQSRSASHALFSIEVPTALPAATGLPTAAVRHSAQHILIILEDEGRAASLKALLEQHDYTAMIATDAVRAVGLALEFPPALIITEYELPGSMTGLDLVRRIAGGHDPVPAAILLTDDLDSSTLRDITTAGFEYAFRTIPAQELLERVRRLLPHSAGAGATPSHSGHIFILDGDAERRVRLSDWLRSQGWTTEEFSTTEEFLAAYTPERHGCVLADWTTADEAGGALLATLRPLAHRLPVIVIADQADIQLAVSAMSAGAVDFIKRPIHGHALTRSLLKAAALVAEREQQQAHRDEHSARLASLTQRQKMILERILAGAPNKIIAADLNLSQRTVENHRATLMAKLGARSLPELIRIVMGAR